MVAFDIKVASVIISKLLGLTILDLYFKPWNLTGNDADMGPCCYIRPKVSWA